MHGHQGAPEAPVLPCVGGGAGVGAVVVPPLDPDAPLECAALLEPQVE